MRQNFVTTSTIYPWFAIFETRSRLKVFPNSGMLLLHRPCDALICMCFVPLSLGPPSHELSTLLSLKEDAMGAIVPLTAELLDTWVW